LGLTVLTIGAAALLVFRLTSQGLNLDEGFSAYLGRISIMDFVATVWNSEFNMVLYYALLRAWMHLGHSEFVIRSLSVVLGAATVPAVYLVGRRLFPQGWIALCASLLFAIHPFHVELSRSARSYSLVILLVTIASYFFVRAVEDPSWANCAAYAMLAAGAVYSHFFALLVVLAHAASLLFFPASIPWKRLFVSFALFLTLIVPFAVFMWRHADADHVAWVLPFHRQQAIYLLYALTLSKWRSLTYIVAWIAALVSAISLARRSGWPYRFIATWLGLPVIVTLLVSIWRPLVVERFLAVCIPASVLLAAAGIAKVAGGSRSVGLALLALTVLYSASNIRHYMRHPEYGENWLEASAYLLSNAQPGDEVVLLAGLGPPTFDYYRERNARKISRLLFADSASAPLPVPPPQNVWFIGSLLLTPNWAAEADAFGQAHKDRYCAESPQPDTGSVRVWQFRRCTSGDNHFRWCSIRGLEPRDDKQRQPR